MENKLKNTSLGLVGNKENLRKTSKNLAVIVRWTDKRRNPEWLT